MPKKMEKELMREAARRRLKGRKKDAFVYGTMNKKGAMHGNKQTGDDKDRAEGGV